MLTMRNDEHRGACHVPPPRYAIRFDTDTINSGTETYWRSVSRHARMRLQHMCVALDASFLNWSRAIMQMWMLRSSFASAKAMMEKDSAIDTASPTRIFAMRAVITSPSDTNSPDVPSTHDAHSSSTSLFLNAKPESEAPASQKRL